MEIEKIFEAMKPKAIYLTGSSVLLPKSNDKDLVLFFETKEQKEEAFNKSLHNTGYCLHFDYEKHIFLGCYIYPKMKKVCGEDIDLNLNIFDEEVKKEYKKRLLDHCGWLKLESKLWYHILTAVYMYENGSYNLNKEQLDKIQEVHDKGITEELKNYCIVKLQ